MKYWKNIVLLPLVPKTVLLLLQRVVGENKVFLCCQVCINTVVNDKRYGEGRLFLLVAHLGHQGHLRKRSGRRPCRSNTVEGQVIPVPEWLERLHLFTFLFLWMYTFVQALTGSLTLACIFWVQSSVSSLASCPWTSPAANVFQEDVCKRHSYGTSENHSTWLVTCGTSAMWRFGRGGMPWGCNVVSCFREGLAVVGG